MNYGNRKRYLDLIFSIPAFFIFSPIMLAVGFLVRLYMGKPVFFRQTRPGLHERPFRIVKFRTMTDLRDVNGNVLSDEQRLTPLGRFLREYSLDELPELINVLWGDMSIVGPRPLLMEYLGHYTKEAARRHNVKPGITGWAQIHGRQEISFSKRIALDSWYVNNWSLSLDLKILIATIFKAFSGAGVIAGQDVQEVDDLGLSADLKIIGRSYNEHKCR